VATGHLPGADGRRMMLLGTCRLVDVLGEWGSHNTQWRRGRDATDILDGVEFALTYYSPLVSRILAAGPIACVRAEFAPEDLPLINIADGRPISDWTTAVECDATHSGKYVREMAAAAEPIVGPLVCTCVGEVVSGDLRVYPPFVIFDGWHRGAAWVLHQTAGRAYPIAARVIATQRPAPLLGQA
jgi:hypothetical protein